MRTSFTIVSGIALLAIGYVAGSSGILSAALLVAQEEPADAAKKAKAKAAPANVQMPNLSPEVRMKIEAAATALNAAADAMRQEGLYAPATKGSNAFSVLTGSCNSLKDLESGRGVDPDTFAALYSGLWVDEIADKMSFDAENRLMYNSKVVRMYPISRLKGMYAVRAAITGEESLIPDQDAGKPAKKKSATDEPKVE